MRLCVFMFLMLHRRGSETEGDSERVMIFRTNEVREGGEVGKRETDGMSDVEDEKLEEEGKEELGKEEREGGRERTLG